MSTKDMNSIDREIPVTAAITIILGRGLTSIGWISFALLMVFAWVFGGQADTSFIHFFGQVQTTEGQVIDVVETNVEVNEQIVWANIFEYSDENGNHHVRDAFTTGRSLRINEVVTVEYPSASPQLGRIPGIRSAEFGSWVLFMWLLPLIGLYMVYLGIRRGKADYHLLKVGKIAEAKLVDKQATSASVNDDPVYKLTFKFTADDNQSYEKILKTHLTEHLEDDELEQLMYDPDDPTKSTLVDDLAGSPKISKTGLITNFETGLPLKPILLPIISVAPHAWYMSTLF